MNLNNIQQQKLDQVRQLAQQRQIPQALALVNEITLEHPDFGPAWYTSAFLLFQSNHIDAAVTAINTARKLEPDNIKYAYQEVMMYEAMNRPDQALPLAQKLASEPLPNNDMNEKLARLLEVNEDFKGALKLYQHLADTHPNKTSWLLKQAAIFQNLGDIERAVELSDKALEREPNNPDGQFFRSHLMKQTTEKNHINTLQACTTSSMSSQDKAKFYYALAKEFEDCEKYDESFQARKTGAELFRSSFQYDVQSDIDFMRQIQVEYNEQFINQKYHGNTSDQPIFIVGLPRSGTTLLDRIITSHTDVKAAGELKQMNASVIQGLQQLNINPQISRIQMVTATKKLDYGLLGKTYLQTSQARAANSTRFTDKFPQNSYYVGMILKALPKAKIIIMQRHPIAVCYAVYKQMFSNDSYPYSYNLEEMARYYNQHNKLLNHWNQVGGDAVKTVYYEDLVSDLENQSKDILGFLNLSWQPQCLDFHKNKQPTATASASQVREKLYTSSIDLWRQYEQHLQPLINNLDLGNSV